MITQDSERSLNIITKWINNVLIILACFESSSETTVFYLPLGGYCLKVNQTDLIGQGYSFLQSCIDTQIFLSCRA